MRRVHAVQSRARQTATAQADLPPGAHQVTDARAAVTEPAAEALAKAQATLIAEVKAEPSQEIVELCKRIREVIRNKRPPDEDALMAAKPEDSAKEAGSSLNSTIQGETAKVQGNYAAMDQPPAPAAPAPGQGLPPQPEAAQTPAVNATAAVPDAVPAENVSLDRDATEAKQKAAAAGMSTAPAALVQSGPVAEARAAQGELDQVAQEGPAQVLARQKGTLAKTEGDMGQLQAQALAALESSRAGAAQGNATRQGGMVGSEESMRTRAAAEAKGIFEEARTAVAAQLQSLPATAMAEWEAAKEVYATQFKADLKVVQQRVDDRHSGVGGWFVGVWDAVTGLPGWAEEAYTKAETAFGDSVTNKLLELSTKVNGVIAACDLIIASARQRIQKVFADLPDSLKGWAAEQRASFDRQLDHLHQEALSARDNFTKQVAQSASSAVDEVRAEIAELRKRAGGVLGRIVGAIGRFLDDPVKFIIDGLLELLGISPPAFWAVIAKIKKIAKDIADDPIRIANNMLQGLAEGFGKFFDNFGYHLLQGFLKWLFGNVQGLRVPKDLSLRSVIGFFLELMGITWPNIRKILVRHIGAKNVALIEKVWSIVSVLIDKGVDGIYEMIKERLDPQTIVDQVVQMAVDYLTTAIMKQAAIRIIALFNPAGAILQALEAIYRVLKWIFQNAARIFTLIETVVNGLTDIIAGNTAAFAAAVEKALALLIAPVIGFIADYLNLGDLPALVAEKVEGMREWILGMIERALVWLIEKGKALLAALGLGKKDKKDEDDGAIGEDIPWTVRKESHHMWIGEEGGQHVAMMASGEPHPVKAAIMIYRKQAKQLAKTDEETAEKAETAIADADTALDALVQAIADHDNKVKAGTAKKDLAAERDTIKEHQQELRHAVAEAQDLLGLDQDKWLEDVKKYFGRSPFSTNEDLTDFLDISDRHARRIVESWKNRGVIFRIESDEFDPEGLNTFDPAVAKWRATNPNNRYKYGYVNPRKTSAVGLAILTKGLLGHYEKGELVKATASQKRDANYHQNRAHYESVVDPGGYPDFRFPEAILGHAPPGASGHWNRKGHKQTREENYAWNQLAASYHGPEHEQESAESSSEAEPYQLPTKGRKSHSSWWKH